MDSFLEQEFLHSVITLKHMVINTDTVVVRPENRYQMTISQDVRQTLGFDEKAASLEIEISLNKILDEDDGGAAPAGIID